VTYFDDALLQLQKQVARKKQLTAFVRELRIQQKTLNSQTNELLLILKQEQKDVDRLEGLSPTAVITRILGTREQKLEQEQLELCAAMAKYNAAAKELETVEQALSRYEAELETLEGCEGRYEHLLAERIDTLRNSGGVLAGEMLDIEKAIGALEKQVKELDEAIAAGNAALPACDQVQKDLSRASGWSTWDVLGDSLVADVAKYSALGDAQSSGGWLQAALRRFKTELADINIQECVGPYISNFTKFGDIFFDNLFFDLSVRHQISGSVSEAAETRRQILGVRSKLEGMKDALEQEIMQLKTRLRNLIAGAEGKE
jgi:uncharacterized protein YceH (UPF0502 family)